MHPDSRARDRRTERPITCLAPVMDQTNNENWGSGHADRRRVVLHSRRPLIAPMNASKPTRATRTGRTYLLGPNSFHSAGVGCTHVAGHIAHTVECVDGVRKKANIRKEIEGQDYCEQENDPNWPQPAYYEYGRTLQD